MVYAALRPRPVPVHRLQAQKSPVPFRFTA